MLRHVPKGRGERGKAQTATGYSAAPPRDHARSCGRSRRAPGCRPRPAPAGPGAQKLTRGGDRREGSNPITTSRNMGGSAPAASACTAVLQRDREVGSGRRLSAGKLDMAERYLLGRRPRAWAEDRPREGRKLASPTRVTARRAPLCERPTQGGPQAGEPRPGDCQEGPTPDARSRGAGPPQRRASGPTGPQGAGLPWTQRPLSRPLQDKTRNCRAGPLCHHRSAGHHRRALPSERPWPPSYGCGCRGRGLPCPRAEGLGAPGGGEANPPSGPSAGMCPLRTGRVWPRRKVLVCNASCGT